MIDNKTINFEKGNGLVPAIVQNNATKDVLMLGYMNDEALQKTIESRKVTFFSRSKNRLWTKGESSGNFLSLEDIKLDCDHDALLVMVTPSGPVCHTGSETCWGDTQVKISNYQFLQDLEDVIIDRKHNPSTQSYTSLLFKKGINKIAQKVGEEAVELVIEAKDDNDELFLNEAADLIYHYLILLIQKGYRLSDVIKVLFARKK